MLGVIGARHDGKEEEEQREECRDEGRGTRGKMGESLKVRRLMVRKLCYV